MAKLNQQTPREPTLGEIAYMKTQEAMLANATSQVEEANYLNNRGYVFQPNNNLPMHYHRGLQNHENLSYDNQAIMPHVPHKLSVSNPPPGFQGQVALSSNNQGQRKPSFFEENILYFLNDMKKRNDSRIANLETTQVNMGASLKNLETQTGQLAQSMKASLSKSFPSNTENNPKEFMAIALRNGKDVTIRTK